MSDQRERINWQGVREWFGLFVLVPVGIALVAMVLAHLLGLWGGPCDQCVDWSRPSATYQPLEASDE